MIRVKSDILDKINGSYYHHGKAFTGIVFLVFDGLIEEAKECESGIVTRNYFSEYLPNSDKQLKIDSDYLEPDCEDDYEPFLCYRGELFSGIAYDFEEDGSCTGEKLYINGQVESEVSYYKSGMLSLVDLDLGDDLFQELHWYESGKIKYFETIEKHCFRFELDLNAEGEITSLHIDGDYLNRLNQVKDKLLFDVNFESKKDSTIRYSDELFLSGDAIDDAFFNHLNENKRLHKIKKLTIFETSLTLDSIRIIEKYNDIEELHIKSHKISESEIEKLKKNKPSCQIVLGK